MRMDTLETRNDMVWAPSLLEVSVVSVWICLAFIRLSGLSNRLGFEAPLS